MNKFMSFPFHISHLAFIKQTAAYFFTSRKLLIDNSLPDLRSRCYFGGVGKIENCELKIMYRRCV